ncbi:MAG: WG repeat-containing protein [Ferruginibacter sp.]
MYKTILSVTVPLLLCSCLFGQDYKIGYKNDDGYTTISQTTLIPARSYQSATTITRYGLMNEAKTIVLPMLYNSVYTSREAGIYIVLDTMNKVGLYSVPQSRFIVNPEYYGIDAYREGLAIVKKEKQPYGFLWGAVDKTGNIVIPLEYEFLGDSYDGLMNFKKDEGYGFIDQKNTVIIPALYSNISNFGNGLAPVLVKTENKYGYIDRNNKLIVPAKYEAAENFYQGYAAVQRKKAVTVKGKLIDDAETALINASGKELTDFNYHSISYRMEGGLFKVSKKEKFGFIDSTGKLVLPVEYKEANLEWGGNIILRSADNKYGMMNVRSGIVLKPEYGYISSLTADHFYYSKDGKATVLDQNKKIIVAPDSAERVLLGKNSIVYFNPDKVKIFDKNGKLIKTFNHENISSYNSSFTSNEDSLRINYDVSVLLLNLTNNTRKIIPATEAGDFNEEGIFIAKKIQYNFFDYTGKKLNSKGFYSAVNFTDGICAIQTEADANPYLADKNFNKIKDLTTAFYGPYSEGIAMSLDKDKSLVVYLDTKGEKVFSITGTEGGKCTDGRVWIKTSYYNYYFFADKTGKQIGSKTWAAMGEFNSGLAAVQENNKWGFISNLGNLAIPVQYDQVSSFYNGTAVVKMNGKFMLINKEGDPIDDKRYEAAGNPSNGYFPLLKDKLVGLVDGKGKTVIDFKYQNILGINEDRSWAMKDGKWGLLDSKGAELTGFIYKEAGDFNNGYARVNINGKYGLVNKAGKLIAPAEYSTLGTVYKNSVIALSPAGTQSFGLK